MAWNGGIKQANFRQELMGALEFEKKFNLLRLKVLPLKTKIVYDTHLNSLFAAAVLGYYTTHAFHRFAVKKCKNAAAEKLWGQK